MPPSIQPNVTTITLCDRISTDTHGRYVLSGILDGMGVTSFPTRTRGFGAYFELVGMHGRVELHASIAAPTDGDPYGLRIARASYTAHAFDNPTAIACVAVSFDGVVFPGPGTYSLILEFQGHVIAERTFHLYLAQSPAR
jgi:hypothetical protein